MLDDNGVRSREYIKCGRWPLGAVPMKRPVPDLEWPQIAVVFKAEDNPQAEVDENHPYVLVLCEPDTLECVFTLASASGPTNRGINAMVHRGEPYTAQQIVDKGWRVD
jgi:hypothetical protein